MSHTFLRREVREMQAMGLDIELYGIRPDASDTLTPQERSLVDRTIYLYPLKIKELIGAKLFFMFRYPSLYLRTLLRALTNEERHPLHYLKMVYHFGIATYLARHMLRQNIQHIHAHFMNVSATQAMYCAGLLDVPFSITNHTGSIKSVKGMIGLREKIRRAQWIGTISDHSRKHLETIYPCREKCHVVRCGLDLTAYAFSPDHHELKTPGLVRLLGIGRMIEVKGFRYLIQSMALLKKNQIPAKLTLIGDGPLREDLKTLAKTEEVSQDVDFVGYRSQEDVVRAFQ